MRILVVDDDREQCQLRALLLSSSGFDALEALDGASAKLLAASQRPTAAVVDLGLPTYEDGFRLIRDLKAIDSDIRVVVLTGAGPNKVASRPEASLIDKLLIKPASTADLIQTLRSYE